MFKELEKFDIKISFVRIYRVYTISKPLAIGNVTEEIGIDDGPLFLV